MSYILPDINKVFTLKTGLKLAWIRVTVKKTPTKCRQSNIVVYLRYL